MKQNFPNETFHTFLILLLRRNAILNQTFYAVDTTASLCTHVALILLDVTTALDRKLNLPSLLKNTKAVDCDFSSYRIIYKCIYAFKHVQH